MTCYFSQITITNFATKHGAACAMIPLGCTTVIKDKPDREAWTNICIKIATCSDNKVFLHDCNLIEWQ